MRRRFPFGMSDVRGAARLATDATTAVTDLVEAMHARIARVPLPGRPPSDDRARGIARLTYASVRGVARQVGGGLDGLFALAGRALPGQPESPAREAVVSALNGVLGDHLAATGNPLAIGMSLRSGGLARAPERDALAAALPDAGSRLVVLLHGLCMNDLQWRRGGHDHGAALHRDLGCTPLYLRYNSGLHVSTNGAAFARLMERLVDAWPQPLERLVIVGHSMGGLVARSALHAAGASGLAWPGKLDDLVFLGTPHHGAPLERAGHVFHRVLGMTPYAAPLARLGRLRSAGITDLRHGSLLDADRADGDRFGGGGDRRRPLPLPAGVRCFAIAGTTASDADDRVDRLPGDGLVPVASALGRHADPARRLDFAPERQWISPRTNHFDLLDRPEVYARLRGWLA